MSVLLAPLGRDELARQPVEQLRMRRLLALLAEVVERRHDAAAKELMPDAIDRHASRQRIGRIDEPAWPGPADRAIRRAALAAAERRACSPATASPGLKKSPRR